MSNDRNRRPITLPPKPVQMGEREADYSYDQWRQEQMRQLEQSYARMEARSCEFTARAPVAR